jgi:hypothetical protein
MTNDEALRLMDLVWGPVKKRNLASPMLGDATWHDILVVTEETVEDALRRALTSPVQGKRARISRRCVINDAVRKATIYPLQYSLPLYVSDGFLADVAAAEARLAPATASSKRRRSVPMPKCCLEHVVPIAVHCSGSRIIAEPEKNLRHLRRTLLGPICLITKDEDHRIDPTLRKRNDRPNRPFGRYKGVAEIRRTDTGERIDKEGFSFRDHLRVMASHPAYATAVPMFNGAAAAWRDRIAQIRRG